MNDLIMGKGDTELSSDLIKLLQFFLCLVLVAVGSSWILKGKQKLGVTYNSDKHDKVISEVISKF